MRLPLELLVTIATFDAQLALKFRLTSKRVRYALDPNTLHGIQLWARLRMLEKCPDPQVIALSDYEFLRAVYGCGCNFGGKYSQLKPMWDLHGLRICQRCFPRMTIPEHEIRTWLEEKAATIPPGSCACSSWM